MALTKCSECKNEVSDSAGKCPHCGAKVSKPAGWLGWICAAIFIFAIVQCSTDIEKSKELSAAIEAAKPLEMREAETKNKALEEARFQKAVIAAKVLKSSLRNPDSVVWEDIYANNDASVICLSYRAQNGFGGMNREHISFINGKPSRSTPVWNRKCTGTGFIDLKYARQAL